MPGPGCGPGRETKEPMTMLKIYGTKTSSNVQKVLWCCGELGLAFERDQNIGGPSRNDRTAAYLALNPNGLIPTIDEAGYCGNRMSASATYRRSPAWERSVLPISH